MSPQDALIQFIARCDPAIPAAPGSYVPRVPPVSDRWALELAPSERSRVLLFGQTGVGKSTELARLAEAVSDRYLVLQPPVDRILDLAGLSWHLILVFAVAHELERPEFRALAVAQNLDKALAPMESHEVVTFREAQGHLEVGGLGPTGRQPPPPLGTPEGHVGDRVR